MTKTPDPAWTPLQRASVPREEGLKIGMDVGLTADQAADALEGEFWVNSRYQVQKRIWYPEDGSQGLPLVWLSIRRLDREAIRDWRDMQRIKNELVGPECEGVELYPAESRCVDSANQSHLFVVLSTTFRFPFGFQERLVIENPPGRAKQRPFEEDSR